MIHVIEHQECGSFWVCMHIYSDTSVVVANGCFGDDDLPQTDDVLMIHHLQQLDLSYGCDGEPLTDDLRISSIDLLQRHKIVRLQAFSFVHLTIRA